MWIGDNILICQCCCLLTSMGGILGMIACRSGHLVSVALNVKKNVGNRVVKSYMLVHSWTCAKNILFHGEMPQSTLVVLQACHQGVFQVDVKINDCCGEVVFNVFLDKDKKLLLDYGGTS
jgi:hypothetical protein